eukprot:142826-Rhodomonas_salina.2
MPLGWCLASANGVRSCSFFHPLLIIRCLRSATFLTLALPQQAGVIAAEHALAGALNTVNVNPASDLGARRMDTYNENLQATVAKTMDTIERAQTQSQQLHPVTCPLKPTPKADAGTL